MIFCDKNGWPVTTTKDRWFQNFIRLVLHTKRIRRGYWNGFHIIKKKEHTNGQTTNR